MSSVDVGGHSRGAGVYELWVGLERILLYEFFFLLVYLGHVLSNIVRFPPLMKHSKFDSKPCMTAFQEVY